jgi:hypothetical protein
MLAAGSASAQSDPPAQTPPQTGSTTTTSSTTTTTDTNGTAIVNPTTSSGSATTTTDGATTTTTTTTAVPPAATTPASATTTTTTTTAVPPAAATTATAPSTTTTVTTTGSGGDVGDASASTTYRTGGSILHNSGVSLTLLGGAVGYPSTVSDRTNYGPAYGVAIGARVGSAVGLEFSYQGSSYTTNGGTVIGSANSGSRIMENGAQALLKLGPSVGPVDLYALGGGGVSRLTVNNGGVFTAVGGGSSVRDGTLYKVPVGGGLDVHIPTGSVDLLLGARGQYNFLFNQSDAFPDVSSSSRKADQVQAQVNAGLMF